MSTGVRVFFIDDEDHLHRFPVKKFDQLGHSSEKFPEFAGRRVRYALVFLEIKDKKPVAIKHTDYSYVQFNKDGSFDDAEFDKSLQMAVDLLGAFLTPKRAKGSLIDARGRFVKKRHDHEFT